MRIILFSAQVMIRSGVREGSILFRRCHNATDVMEGAAI